jgi:hypothetical protein
MKYLLLIGVLMVCCLTMFYLRETNTVMEIHVELHNGTGNGYVLQTSSLNSALLINTELSEPLKELKNLLIGGNRTTAHLLEELHAINDTTKSYMLDKVYYSLVLLNENISLQDTTDDKKPLRRNNSYNILIDGLVCHPCDRNIQDYTIPPQLIIKTVIHNEREVLIFKLNNCNKNDRNSSIIKDINRLVSSVSSVSEQHIYREILGNMLCNKTECSPIDPGNDSTNCAGKNRVSCLQEDSCEYKTSSDYDKESLCADSVKTIPVHTQQYTTWPATGVTGYAPYINLNVFSRESILRVCHGVD